MKRKPMIWIIRCLAAGHVIWGTVLLLVATLFGLGMTHVYVQQLTGIAWTDLPGLLLLVGAYVIPLAGLGLWMVVLGYWSWTLRFCLRTALCLTHGIMLLPGSLAVILGVYAMRAAERSTEGGGGLMSPLAVLPLLFGIPVLVLSLCSIAAALALAHTSPESGQDPFVVKHNDRH